MVAKAVSPPEGLLPHDKEAEQGVLGAIIHDNEAIYQASELLTPESFFSPAHRELFAAMLALSEREDPIDELTLGSYLRSRSKLEQVGGVVYIAELFDATPVTANVLVYAEIVREKYQLRTLINAATEIANRGRESTEDVSGLIQEAESVFLDLSTNATRRSYSHIKDLLSVNFQTLEEAGNRPDGLLGQPTGFRVLDDKTKGLQPGALIVLAARPGMGKTSFALSIAKYSAISSGLPSVFFSLEMPKEQISLRLLCMEAAVDNQKLLGDKLDEFEWDKLAAAAGRLSEAPIIIDEADNLTPLSLKATCRRIQAESGLGLVIVDYLQLMKGNHRTDNREQEIAEISRTLKSIAKELSVPIMACAQLNRQLEGRQDKRPHLFDLRESGAIEQDADIVMFIYRDEIYNPNTEDPGIAEIHIAKNRSGPVTNNPNEIRLVFLKEFTKFSDLSYRPDDETSFN